MTYDFDSQLLRSAESIAGCNGTAAGCNEIGHQTASTKTSPTRSSSPKKQHSRNGSLNLTTTNQTYHSMTPPQNSSISTSSSSAVHRLNSLRSTPSPSTSLNSSMIKPVVSSSTTKSSKNVNF